MTKPLGEDFHQNKNRLPTVSEECRTLARLSPPFIRFPKVLLPAEGFTLVELLGVITVIGILAGLTLGAGGVIRRQSCTAQAKSQIAALQTACERYFTENNTYPTTNSMPNPSSDFNPFSPTYQTAGKVLFSELFGTNLFNRPPSTKRYFEPKLSMVNTNGSSHYFVDPWGNAYGYNSDGTNAPLIWSTANEKTGASSTNKWITSWPKI